MNRVEMINASAGSGKTYRLTQKILEKIEEGLNPEALMATTFTNKAAAELRERIRSQLLKDGRYEEAQRIYDGFIGTVNSICARLLRGYAQDAGLSPAVDILPEEDSERLFNVSISSVMDKFAPDIDPVAERLGRAGGGSGFGQPADWRRDVRLVVEAARSNRVGIEALRRCRDTSLMSLLSLFGPPSTIDLDLEMTRAVDAAVKRLETIDQPRRGTEEVLNLLKEYRFKKRRGLTVPWSLWVSIYKQDVNKDGRGMADEVRRIASNLLSHQGFRADITQVIEGVFDCAVEALSAYESFKLTHGLMDFVDQETKVLELARCNDAFRESMSDRLSQLMVDEFQDTSPIQLALFIELHRLAGQSVWVGDPKQVIYGFRGADPELIDAVAGCVGTTEILDRSWRSRRELVEFCNHVFTAVFHELGEDKVRLRIPEEKSEEADGGWLESWNLEANNNSQETGAIAQGIRELLEKRSDLKPGDIAVLCRTNDKCRAVAGKLEAIGIPTSSPQGSLLQARECILALAALRFMNDENDSLALMEIVSLSPLHSIHEDWLETLVSVPENTLIACTAIPFVKALLEARKDLDFKAPLEALEIAIDRVRLIDTIKTWGEVARRMRNLDSLRECCVAYVERSLAIGSSATVTGFINYVREKDPEQPPDHGEDTLQVLTYHRAKGLEWPVVVLTGLDQDPARKADAFGVHVQPAKKFDPENPLAGRTIRYWPWPFGAQRSIPVLEGRLEESKEHLTVLRQERENGNRLLYVGMTRAKEGLIFAVRKKETRAGVELKSSWLDTLTDRDGRKLITLPLERGLQEITVAGRAVALTVREFSDGGEEEAFQPAGSAGCFQAPAVDTVITYPRARLTPTSIRWSAEELGAVVVKKKSVLGERLIIRGTPVIADLGNAVHGFLGADRHGAARNDRIAMAEGLLRRWQVSESFTPEDMLEASDRLNRFIEDHYPEASVFREWPITLRNEQNQLLHGWIDLLLEVDGGYVIIDHKSYPGADAMERVREFVPQLYVYKEAVEKATSKPVLEEMVHLPITGEVFQLRKSD